MARTRSRALWVARKLEHVADRTALHPGIGTPGALRIFISVPPAVVCRVGVDEYARRAVLLRHKCFHPAKVLPIAHQHDLAANIYFHLFEFLKIIRRSVVRIHHLALDISRGRHAIERRNHPRIVLVRIAIHPLAVGPCIVTPAGAVMSTLISAG